MSSDSWTLHRQPGLLAVRTRGPLDGVPLVALHGFLADGRLWQEVADALDRPVRWIAVDLPGHGASLVDLQVDGQAGAWAGFTALLQASIDPYVHQQPLLLGYSLGGRCAAWLALRARLPLAGLALLSAHPGLPDERQRAQRRQEDEARAKRLLDQGLQPFVAAWEALPLFAPLARLDLEPAGRARRQRLARVRNDQDPAGLALSLRAFGTGTQTDLTLQPPRDLPAVLLAGGEDPAYVAHLAAWQRLLPQAQGTVLPGVGHALPTEAPDAVARVLAAWIDRSERAPAPATC